MKRRSFLGFLGGAAVAGPSAAKSAAQLGIADLAPAGIGLSGSHESPCEAKSVGSALSNVVRAKQRLKDMMGMSAHLRDKRKREHYLQGLDPDTASLRSVSLTTRIRLSRDRQFEASERQQKTYWQGIIDGLWE